MATLTPANLGSSYVGYARVGNGLGLTGAGSFDTPPFTGTGLVLEAIATHPTFGASIAFQGSFAGPPPIPSIKVDGADWTLGTGSYESGGNFTTFPLTKGAAPNFTAGVTATVTSRGLPSSNVQLSVDPDGTSGAALSPSLPAPVSGSRTLTTTHMATTPNSIYMAMRVKRTASNYPPFAFMGLANQWYNGDGAQIAASSGWLTYASGVYDVSVPETYQNQMVGGTVTENFEVLEGFWDDVDDVWRVVLNGGLIAETPRGEAVFPFQYSYLNTYEGLFELSHFVVMSRVPNIFERSAIRDSFNNAAGPVAPVITSSAAFYVKEGTQLAAKVTATKPRADLSVTGGADSSKIATSGDTLVWENGLPRSYDSPDDAGGNGVYEVNIAWTDLDGLTANQSITITLQRQPVFAPKDLNGWFDNSKIDFMGEDDPASVIINKDFFPVVVPSSDPLYIGARSPSNVYIGAATVSYVGPRTFFP